MRIIAALLLTFCFSSTAGLSQSNKCGTKERKDYPAAFNAPHQLDDSHTWNVPVIFHVLYKTNEQNVSDSLILGILETLHADFLAQNPDFASLPEEFKFTAGNPNINFTLAQTLPDGQPTPGIIRVKTNRSLFKLNQRYMFSESAIIDSKKYLNVYICNTNTNAFTPSEDNARHDGVVIDYTKVTKGSRTLTHEAGHWLDLRHIFGSRCKDQDGVADTRPQKKHAHNCPTYPRKECSQSVMFMNYMDYSSCRYFFTAGQVARMRSYALKHKNFN